MDFKAPLPHARYERFEGVRQYDDMFDELIPKTQRVIRVFDKALGPGYATTARCDLLTTFLRADPLNRLFIVVHETQSIERLAPRLGTLLQRFSHVAKVRQTPRWARHIYDPFVIFDASHYVHRFHHERIRFARGMNDVDGAQTLLDRYAELWDASKPSPVASVTGL